MNGLAFQFCYGKIALLSDLHFLKVKSPEVGVSADIEAPSGSVDADLSAEADTKGKKKGGFSIKMPKFGHKHKDHDADIDVKGMLYNVLDVRTVGDDWSLPTEITRHLKDTIKCISI